MDEVSRVRGKGLQLYSYIEDEAIVVGWLEVDDCAELLLVVAQCVAGLQQLPGHWTTLDVMTLWSHAVCTTSNHHTTDSTATEHVVFAV